MNEELASEIRNKLTVPMVALERLIKVEKVPKDFLDKAFKELKAAIKLLKDKTP